MKPLLQPLIANNIKYHWAFPFRLNFTFRNKKHAFSTFSEGETLLRSLGSISTKSGGPPHIPQFKTPNTGSLQNPPSQVQHSTRKRTKFKAQPRDLIDFNFPN